MCNNRPQLVHYVRADGATYSSPVVTTTVVVGTDQQFIGIEPASGVNAS